jgi:hypothetical protein
VSGVNLHSLPGTASSQVPVGGGDRARQPRWRQTGEELFFADDDNISVVTATWTPTLKFPNQPRVLFPIPLPFRVAFGQWAPGWDVHPDGQRFLVTNPPPNTPAASIEIITNWETLLERSSP